MKKYIQTNAVLLLLLLPMVSFSQEISTPESYRNTVVQDTVNSSTIKWKAFFKEPDLIKLIEEAVAKNNDLQIADQNVAIANLQYKQSKWGNVPQLNGFANAGTTRLSDNSLNGANISQSLGKKHIEDYNAGIALSWEVGIWGKIRNQKKSALNTYLQTAEAKKALQTAIIAEVSNSFYDLIMLDAQLDIAKRTLELNDSTLFIVNLQYESGQVTALAKQQTEAQRLIAAQLVPQLEQNIQVVENGLSVLTGSFPDAKERTSKLSRLTVKEGFSAGIPAQLLDRRPDVKSAELALKVANANVGITKAGLYPTLNITANAGVSSFEISNWFNLPASLFGSVAGSLTAPLLNGKKLRTRYEISKIERDQAAIQFRQTILVAVSEVSNALTRVDKLSQQYAISKQRVATLQAAISNADLLFKNGMATYLEVIIAQGNLLNAQLELAAIKKDQLISNVELYRALGGGWEN